MQHRQEAPECLSVRSVTLREVAGGATPFPSRVREAICSAVGSIRRDELESLLKVHEADPGNLDGRVEMEIRKLAPLLTVVANQPVSSAVRFNSDLVIEAGDDLVCLEIEKSYLARFELDVLKMQVFAAQTAKARPAVRCFGAFIVPTDNVVARHIAGGSRESSYAYLCRLSRLIAEIAPLQIEDILIVGYGVLAPEGEQEAPQKPQSRGESVLRADGLLPDDAIIKGLRRYPTGLILDLRRRLAAACPGLCEKFNPRVRYLGYSRKGESDSVYMHVQKRRLVLDLRLSAERADEVRQSGLQVKPRMNYQGMAGWLTGVLVPHGTDHQAVVVQLVLEALQGD